MSKLTEAVRLSKTQSAAVRNNPDAQRLMGKVAIANNDCWHWIGAANSDGYGYLRFRGKTWKAHRVSYTIFIGEIPGDLVVCHHCDNPACVNPSHLFLGHRAANMLDMVRKGRAKFLITSEQSHFRSGCAPAGDEASGSKLRIEDVEGIIALASGGVSTASLVQQYGVARSTIQAILRGESWKEVRRPANLPRRTGFYQRQPGIRALEDKGEGR